MSDNIVTVTSATCACPLLGSVDANHLELAAKAIGQPLVWDDNKAHCRLNGDYAHTHWNPLVNRTDAQLLIDALELQLFVEKHTVRAYYNIVYYDPEVGYAEGGTWLYPESFTDKPGSEDAAACRCAVAAAVAIGSESDEFLCSTHKSWRIAYNKLVGN